MDPESTRPPVDESGEERKEEETLLEEDIPRCSRITDTSGLGLGRESEKNRRPWKPSRFAEKRAGPNDDDDCLDCDGAGWAATGQSG